MYRRVTWSSGVRINWEKIVLSQSRVIWQIKNLPRPIFRPRSIYECQQNCNPSSESVPLGINSVVHVEPFKAYTANEGPAKNQYKCLVSFMYFQKWNCYFQNIIIMFCLPVPTLIYLWEIYIFPALVCIFCCREICGPILGIYKSLTDTWMWKFKIGTEAAQFPEKEYLNGTFLAVYSTLV